MLTKLENRLEGLSHEASLRYFSYFPIGVGLFLGILGLILLVLH